jgi:hypothetical protein
MFLKISFISHKDNFYVLRSELLDLSHPFEHMLKAEPVSDIIHENDSVSHLVIVLGDIHKTVLASCVPNLELHYLVVYLDLFDLVVDSNCRNVGLWTLVIGKPYQEASLADAGVSDDDHLGEVVEVSFLLGALHSYKLLLFKFPCL